MAEHCEHCSELADEYRQQVRTLTQERDALLAEGHSLKVLRDRDDAIQRAERVEADLARVREYVDWLLDPTKSKGGTKVFQEACVGVGINLRLVLSGAADKPEPQE